jgi:hypothetical protein
VEDHFERRRESFERRSQTKRFLGGKRCCPSVPPSLLVIATIQQKCINKMPSRKKAKGKARRAAKEAKAVEEEVKEETVAVTSYDRGSLETQMQRLTVDDLLRESGEAKNLLSKLLIDGFRCRHGLELLERRCEEFVEAFHDGYNACFEAGNNDMGSCFSAGFASTGKFTDVWKSVAMLKDIAAFYVASGAQDILGGDEDNARELASIICYFEQQIAVAIEETPFINMQDVAELHWADMNTLVNYYRKRIPCKCLDKKYKEVKSITKMGLCCNQACSHPDRQVERKKMFCCSGCNRRLSLYMHQTSRHRRSPREHF